MTDLAYLERRSTADNLARFYRVALEPGLFGDVAVIRRWGRIGSNGQELRTWHGDQASAEREAGRWIGRKRRRGYLDGPLPYVAAPNPLTRAARARLEAPRGREGVMGFLARLAALPEGRAPC